MEQLSFTITEEHSQQRLDAALAQLVPEYSRSQLSKWIKKGHVAIENIAPEKITSRIMTQENQVITLQVPKEENVRNISEAIALDIIHEDEDILVINKPAGLTVHPGAGQANQTLLNALLHHNPCFSEVPRAGIVHRLDKLTSGLMVVAKNLISQTALVRQLQERSINRRYLAIINNVPITAFSCSKPIGRHPTQRIKMSVLERGGKSAHTDFSILKKYRKHALLEATLSTGRTHQIRVHLSHLGYAIVGDKVYGKRPLLAKNMSPNTIESLQQLKRQSLHAHYLELQHPLSNETMQFNSPLPEELKKITDVLEQDLQANF